jgi:hypothetical protein
MVPTRRPFAMPLGARAKGGQVPETGQLFQVIAAPGPDLLALPRGNFTVPGKFVPNANLPPVSPV